MWVMRRNRPSGPHCPAGTVQHVSGSPRGASVRSLTISASFPPPTTRTWRNSTGRGSRRRTAAAARASTGQVTASAASAAPMSSARLATRPGLSWPARRSGISGIPHTSSRQPVGTAMPSPASRGSTHTSAPSRRQARSAPAAACSSPSRPATMTRLTRCWPTRPARSAIAEQPVARSPSSGCSRSSRASCSRAGPPPASTARSVSRPRRCAARSAAYPAARTAIRVTAVTSPSRATWTGSAAQGSSSKPGRAAATTMRPTWSVTRRQIRSRCSPIPAAAANTTAA